jgi:hypothetical protein
VSETDTPRVEATIDAAMKRHPGVSPAAMARYYEDVHQDLAPLARAIERELAAALSRIATLERENWNARKLLPTRVEAVPLGPMPHRTIL